MTVPELSEVIAVTERSIERAIEKLRHDKKLMREGASHGGKWKVLGE